MSDSLARLGDAMQVWLRHCTAPDCSAAELLARHPALRDLLEPLLTPPPDDGTTGGRPPRLGEFRVEREIGRGGMGIVYQAVQESLGRRVAVKALVQALPDAEAVARFRRERELLARLRHDHLLPVFEAGTTDGVPWFAMELVDGGSLAEVIDRLRRDPAPRTGTTLAAAHAALLGGTLEDHRLRAGSHADAVLACVLPIAEALAHAHTNHVLHRDVKPANILLRRDGTPLLADFGLARDIRDPALTRAGHFAGTPYYVSPEQAAGKLELVDERTDVFALGVVLYELLLLERPFDGDTSERVLDRVRHADPPALSRRITGLSRDLVAVLDKALQKRPQDRYRDMATFVADLRRLQAGQPVSVRRSGWPTRTWRAIRRRPAPLATTLAIVGALATTGLLVRVWWQRPLLQAGEHAALWPQVEEQIEEAMLARAAGDFGAAAAALAAATTLMPDSAEVLIEQWLLSQHADDLVTAATARSRLGTLAPELAEQARVPLAQTEPGSALGWFVRAGTALEVGARDGDAGLLRQAASAAQRAIERAPRPRAAYHTMSLRTAMETGDWERVRTLVVDIRQLWPRAPFANYWCGVATRMTSPDASLVETRDALRHRPDHPALHALLAQLLIDDDPSAAIGHADTALAARPAWMSLHAIKARALLARRLPEQAFAVCDLAAATAPDHADIHGIRGRALGHLGRFDEALRACERAQQLAPHRATPWIHRADVCDRMRDFAMARAAADQAVSREPGNPLAHLALALAQSRGDTFADAIPTYERALALAPGHYKAWHDLADARRRCGRLDAAEQAVRESLRLRPDFHRAHHQLGMVLAARGNLGEAMTCFERALACQPDDVESRLRLAAAHFQRREFAAGLQRCDEARALAPEINEGWTLAIRALLAVRRRSDALALHRQYCAARPTQADVRLAFCEQLLTDPTDDDFARAEQVLVEAETLAPGSSEVVFWRGELALGNEDLDAARAAFAAAAAAPDLPEALRTRARERLANLR